MGLSQSTQRKTSIALLATSALSDNLSTHLLADQYSDPELTCCERIGLITRAFVMSLPQGISLSSAFIFSFSALFTPVVFNEASEEGVQNYFLGLTIGSLLSIFAAVFYDTFFRLKKYFDGGAYDSFGIFRLRATFMGATLGNAALRAIIYDLAQSKNIWLNFSLTLPATMIPAFIRYSTFKHDIIPATLNSKDNQMVMPSAPQKVKTGILNSRFFNIVSATCGSASAGLLIHRIVLSVLLNGNFRPLTTTKILSALVPGIFGGLTKLLEPSHPDITYRWKQCEILAADAAMILMAISNSLPNPKNEMSTPSYWHGTVAYTVFALSILLAAIQASRVLPPSSRNRDPATP